MLSFVSWYFCCVAFGPVCVTAAGRYEWNRNVATGSFIVILLLYYINAQHMFMVAPCVSLRKSSVGHTAADNESYDVLLTISVSVLFMREKH